MKTRFDGMNLADAQKLYRELIMQNHPDRGGDVEEAKAINAEWYAFTARQVNDAFSANDTKTGDNNASQFAEILRTVAGFKIRVEIIGFWIYCFDSFEYREQLKALGLWYSGKHKAWIFSGSAKKRVFRTYSTDRNRAVWGCTKVASTYREPEAIGATA